MKLLASVLLVVLMWVYPEHGPEISFNVYASNRVPPVWGFVTNVTETEVALPTWLDVELMLFRVKATNSATLLESE